MAPAAAVRPGKQLSDEEMDHLIASLFSLKTPNYTPDGRLIVSIITIDELASLLETFLLHHYACFAKMPKFALVKTLTPHIQYLIVNNDCVVIPGWGALVASVSHSRLTDGRLTPPCRSIGFNQALTHTDGMLASSIARRDGISYQVADSIVRDGVDELRNIYDVNGEVSIDRIGTFTRDDNGSMIFSPAADSIANSPYFGLPALALRLRGD